MHPRVTPSPHCALLAAARVALGKRTFADTFRAATLDMGLDRPAALPPGLARGPTPKRRDEDVPTERGPPAFVPLAVLQPPPPGPPPVVTNRVVADVPILLEQLVSSMRLGHAGGSPEVQLRLTGGAVRVALRYRDGRIGAELDADPGDEALARRLAKALELGLAAREIDLDVIEVR